MMIFLFAMTLLSLVTLGVLVRVWTPPVPAVQSTTPVPATQPDTDPEWQVLLAKREEIEHDVLMPEATRLLLRAEWQQSAAAILARVGRAAAAANPAPVSAVSHAWWIAGLTCLGALALYAAIGRWDAQALAFAPPVAMLAGQAPEALPPAGGTRHPGSGETLEERIAKLEAKLKAAPTDLDGWVLLARSRGIQRDFAGAARALETALALAPGHPDLLADLADALAMTSAKSLAGRPTQLIAQALQADPAHRKALSLAATAAMQAGDLSGASTYWQRLRMTFAPGAPDVAQIDAILAELETTMAKASSPAVATAAPTGIATGIATGTASIPVAASRTPARADQSGPASRATITGQVRLAPALQTELKARGLPARAALFIFAKLPSGPPMPIAAMRVDAQPLLSGQAIAFTLDDSMAMGPDLKLSGAASVTLEARLSMTGTATRQAGDPGVAVNAVPVGSSGVQLLITAPSR